MKRVIQTALLALGAASAQAAETAICYNCPPEWADWAGQIKAIKDATGIVVPPDNKNSGQALAAMAAEKGVTFGYQAAKDGLAQSYKPARWTTSPPASSGSRSCRPTSPSCPSRPLMRA